MPELPPEATERWEWLQQAREHDSFSQALGLAVDEVTETRVRGRIDVTPRLHQSFGFVHGGVYCSIVEALASWGANAYAVRHGMVTVGIENACHFIRAHRSGPLLGDARAVAQTTDSQLWEVDITRHVDGELVASGRLRLKNLPPEWATGDRDAGQGPQ